MVGWILQCLKQEKKGTSTEEQTCQRLSNAQRTSLRVKNGVKSVKTVFVELFSTPKKFNRKPFTPRNRTRRQF